MQFKIDNLQDANGNELLLALDIIPPGTTSLDLSENQLAGKTSEDLVNFLSGIPESVVSLNLSKNSLGLIARVSEGNETLKKIFSAIPKSVTSLNLSDNYLSVDPINCELDEAFAGISDNVTSLNLSYNELGSIKEIQDLKKIIAAILKSVTSLDFTFNNLEKIKKEDIDTFFGALSSNVVHINLGKNFRHFFDGYSNLGEILVKIPSSIISVDFIEGVNKKDEALLPALISQLPSSVEAFTFGSQKIVSSEFWPRQLLSQVSVIAAKKGNDGLCFDTVTLPFDIDETHLCNFIDTLEKKNTEIAFLTCVLLLDGQIATCCEENHPNAYFEKRTHDAISFYLKAAKNSELQPLVNFLLWEMRLATDIISIRNRLSYCDLTPPKEYIPTFNDYKTPGEAVKQNLRRDHPSLFFKTLNSLEKQTVDAGENNIIIRSAFQAS